MAVVRKYPSPYRYIIDNLRVKHCYFALSRLVNAKLTIIFQLRNPIAQHRRCETRKDTHTPRLAHDAQH